jgi:ribosomal-protein-alanine N-acetyltransferase
MLPLRTARLEVRELTGDDLDDLTEVYADPRVLWWEPAPYDRSQTLAALARVLQRYREDGIGEYAVVLRASGRVIGECGPAYREIEGERLPELGWKLRSDEWGRGYATEAARAVVGHVMARGDIPRLFSVITPGNERSQGVARNLGMQVERVVTWKGVPHQLWAVDVRATMDPPPLTRGS